VGLGAEPYWHDNGVHSAWWRGVGGSYLRWIEGVNEDNLATQRTQDGHLNSRLYGQNEDNLSAQRTKDGHLNARLYGQNEEALQAQRMNNASHLNARLYGGPPINLFEPHNLKDTRLWGTPTGLGDVTSDLTAFNGAISAGDANLSNGDFSGAVTSYQAAGNIGASPLGPDIDTQTNGASQSLTQQAWGINTNNLSTIDASTATATDAANAQSLVQTMRNLYVQALQATPNPTPPPTGPSDLDTAANALLQRLKTGGCTTAAFAECSTFQTAWNAAGGTPSLAVDGQYGAQVAACLQGALNIGANQPPEAAPAGCFPSTSPQPIQQPVISKPPPPVAASTKNWTPWIIGGVVVAGVLGGAYLYKKKHGRMPRLAA
jgi:hypothetical protein